MTESETSPVLMQDIPDAVVVEPQQPWWIGSLICVFIAATGHYGMLELFGNTAFITTIGFLALGCYMGFYGLWKNREQTALSLLAIAITTLCLGIAIWMRIEA